MVHSQVHSPDTVVGHSTRFDKWYLDKHQGPCFRGQQGCHDMLSGWQQQSVQTWPWHCSGGSTHHVSSNLHRLGRRLPNTMEHLLNDIFWEYLQIATLFIEFEQYSDFI